MNGDAVKFKSVFTALAVIYAADKYRVKKLDILALKFIKNKHCKVLVSCSGQKIEKNSNLNLP